jgi:predicted nucleotide-binding protein
VRAEDLRAFLTERGTQFEEDQIQSAIRFRGPDGEVFCVYDTGSFVPQGNRGSALAVAVEDWAGRAVPAFAHGAQVAARAPAGPPVFIVYGHDIPARDKLELLLRRMGLEPVILASLPAAGDTIIEKLEQYLGEHGNVGYACVLLTPDDEGYKAGRTEEKKYRARQNVVLELGMVLGRLGRRRVAILHKRSVELPSDIDGLIYIAFQERLDEVKVQLFRELESAGYRPRPSAL